MKLLVITQSVDLNNPILGFFHRWIEEFAKSCEKVTVICLEKGKYDLPEGVKILSLGKEVGQPRLKYLWRFYKYIWQERKNYDSVFVHMNQEYVLLGGLIWKLLGRKVWLWRNHAYGNILTRIAVTFSCRVFCTSPQSYTARFSKTELMPVGIDTDLFKRKPEVNVIPKSILFLGRVSPVKRPDLFIESLRILRDKGYEFVATIVGDSLPSDRAYHENLKRRVSDLGLEGRVKFVPAVNHAQTVDLYNSHKTFVNLTPAGSMDKTIFEAMACGSIVLTSNGVLSSVLGKRFIFEQNDLSDFTDKLIKALELGQEEKGELDKVYGEYVQGQSLKETTSKICKDGKGRVFYLADIRLPTEKAHGIQIMKTCESLSREGISLQLVVSDRNTPIKDNPFHYYSVNPTFLIQRLSSWDLVKWGRVGFWTHSLTFTLSALCFAIRHPRSTIYSRDVFPLFFLSFLPVRIFWESHVPKYSFLVNRVVRKASGLVVISGGLKKFYLAKGIAEGKILVAHDAVDLSQFIVADPPIVCREKLSLPKDAKIISYCGKFRTMGKGKGVEELVTAFVEVSKKIDKAFLLLIGANPSEVSEMERHIRSRGIATGHYRVVPHVSQQEIPFYLHLSDVLIMNYPAKEHYALYMSPLKLFEYMASGVPIVSTDLPSIREVLTDESAIFVPPDHIGELSTGIIKVLTEPELGQKLARRARSEVEKYTWENRALSIARFMTSK